MQKFLIEEEIYEFSELDEKSRDKAINDEILFCIDVIVNTIPQDEWSDGLRKALNEVERLHTPWFLGEAIWEYCEEEILEACRANKYFRNGEIFVPENYTYTEEK
jgi:hypothetical protein